MCLGIPSKVLSITDGPLPMARVDTAGQERDCSLLYTPDVKEGDWVLVRSGFVTDILDEDAAKQAWAAFEDVGISTDGLTDDSPGYRKFYQD